MAIDRITRAQPERPRDAAADPAQAGGSEPLTADLLFRRHHQDVLRIVTRLLGAGASRHDVEDVAQQAFIAAYRSLPRFRGQSKPSTWLYRIAVSAVLMHLRSWKRRRRLLESFVASWIDPPPEDPAQRLEQRQELERAWVHLERMSAKKRIVFVLYEVEGLSGAEIAEVLDLEPATVWTRLHHARKELVQALRKERER